MYTRVEWSMAMAIPPFGLVIGPLLLEFHTNFVSFLLHHLTSAQRSMYSRCFNINVVLHVGIKTNPFKNGSQNVSHWEDPREMMWQQCIYLYRWQTALNANELYSNTNDLKKKKMKSRSKEYKKSKKCGLLFKVKDSVLNLRFFSPVHNTARGH